MGRLKPEYDRNPGPVVREAGAVTRTTVVGRRVGLSSGYVGPIELYSRRWWPTAVLRRRLFLSLSGAVLASLLAGCGSTAGVGGLARSTPETNTVLKTVTPPDIYREEDQLLRRVVLYESGGAKIFLAPDHACFERIGFTHEALSIDDRNTEEALAVWDAPQFGGPITVDLRRAVRREEGYPSRQFKIKLLAESGETCFAMAVSEITFTVPEEYMP